MLPATMLLLYVAVSRQHGSQMHQTEIKHYENRIFVNGNGTKRLKEQEEKENTEEKKNKKEKGIKIYYVHKQPHYDDGIIYTKHTLIDIK